LLSKLKITPEVSQKLKEINPYFFSYRDLSSELKAMAKCGRGMCMIVAPKGKRIVLPNGIIFEANGMQIFPSGLKIIPLSLRDKNVRVKYVRPDGTEMKDGEIFTGSDGVTFRSGSSGEGFESKLSTSYIGNAGRLTLRCSKAGGIAVGSFTFDTSRISGTQILAIVGNTYFDSLVDNNVVVASGGLRTRYNSPSYSSSGPRTRFRASLAGTGLLRGNPVTFFPVDFLASTLCTR
jgi:hypothetical protein